MRIGLGIGITDLHTATIPGGDPTPGEGMFGSLWGAMFGRMFGRNPA